MKKLFYIILMVVAAALLAAGLTACDEREFENPQYWASREADTAENSGAQETPENRTALPNRPESDTSDTTPSNPPESATPPPASAADSSADDAPPATPPAATPPAATPPPAETPAETPQAETPAAPPPAESEPEPETGIPEGEFPPETTGEEPAEPATETEPAAESTHEFRTGELGLLVKTDENTAVAAAEKPAWSKQSVAVAAFVRLGGKRYEVLVYERTAGETFSQWMAKSESGDAYLSPQTVRTKNDYVGYVYETNDYGAVPDVHIFVPTPRFVYRFSSEETRKEVPEDFLQFVRELEVE